MPNVPDKIIVHHTASSRDRTTIAEINKWHKDRGFTKSETDLYVGYHYVITGNGVVENTRRWYEVGCHTIGENTTSIGIALTGNFDIELPSFAQEIALGRLLCTLMSKHGIPIISIYPHRKFSDTHCPGTRLSNDWAQRIALGAEISRIKKLLQWLTIQLSKKLN